MNKQDTSQFYRIRLEGHLESYWSDWFDGLTLTQHEDDKAVLFGPVKDQAALRSLLIKIRDLGLTMHSIARIEPN